MIMLIIKQLPYLFVMLVIVSCFHNKSSDNETNNTTKANATYENSLGPYIYRTNEDLVTSVMVNGFLFVAFSDEFNQRIIQFTLSNDGEFMTSKNISNTILDSDATNSVGLVESFFEIDNLLFVRYSKEIVVFEVDQDGLLIESSPMYINELMTAKVISGTRDKIIVVFDDNPGDSLSTVTSYEINNNELAKLESIDILFDLDDSMFSFGSPSELLINDPATHTLHRISHSTTLKDEVIEYSHLMSDDVLDMDFNNNQFVVLSSGSNNLLQLFALVLDENENTVLELVDEKSIEGFLNVIQFMNKKNQLFIQGFHEGSQLVYSTTENEISEIGSFSGEPIINSMGKHGNIFSYRRSIGLRSINISHLTLLAMHDEIYDSIYKDRKRFNYDIAVDNKAVLIGASEIGIQIIDNENSDNELSISSVFSFSSVRKVLIYKDYGLMIGRQGDINAFKKGQAILPNAVSKEFSALPELRFAFLLNDFLVTATESQMQLTALTADENVFSADNHSNVPNLNITHLDVFGDDIIYSDGDKLYQINFTTEFDNYTIIELHDEGPLRFVIKNDLLYALHDRSFKTYRIKNDSLELVHEIQVDFGNALHNQFTSMLLDEVSIYISSAQNGIYVLSIKDQKKPRISGYYDMKTTTIKAIPLNGKVHALDRFFGYLPIDDIKPELVLKNDSTTEKNKRQYTIQLANTPDLTVSCTTTVGSCTVGELNEESHQVDIDWQLSSNTDEGELRVFVGNSRQFAITYDTIN